MPFTSFCHYQPILLFFSSVFVDVCCLALAISIHSRLVLAFSLSLSHVSLSQAHLLSMSACLSLCVCLHVFRICRRISRLFSYTLCGVRYALFVCFLSAIVAPSIYWAIFLSVCAMKTIWNALSRFVRANILWRPYLICVSLYWFFFLSSTSSSSSSAFLFFLWNSLRIDNLSMRYFIVHFVGMREPCSKSKSVWHSEFVYAMNEPSSEKRRKNIPMKHVCFRWCGCLSALQSLAPLDSCAVGGILQNELRYLASQTFTFFQIDKKRPNAWMVGWFRNGIFAMRKYANRMSSFVKVFVVQVLAHVCALTLSSLLSPLCWP